MTGPNAYDWQCLKRLGRYLKSRPRSILVFKSQNLPSEIRIFVDSDHAGCLLTRRSTTGLVALFGTHTLKSTSKVQTTISLSSGESEYYGIVSGCATGLGLQALFADLNLPVSVRVLSDSSAAIGSCSRRGLGKLRHIQTRWLWVPERVRSGDVSVQKIGTDSNLADALTNP